MPAPDLSHLSIVLVEPEEPGNIGSVARAMRTMGLSRLILVNPVSFDVPEARKMAHGSQDLVLGAKVCPTLQEALADTALVVGTTHERREDRPLIYPPAESARRLVDLPAGQKGAIVFGRESRGLTNEELRLCNLISRVPAVTRHPSLNLAQAVLVYVYELSQASRGGSMGPRLDLATFEEMEGLYSHIQQALDHLGFVSRNAPCTFLRSVRRVFGRVQFERRDAATVHKLCRAVDKFTARNRPGGA